MPKKGYKQTEEHKRKHTSKIQGVNNGMWRGGIKKLKYSNRDIERRRLLKELNPQKLRQDYRRNRLRRYGLTIDDYDEMVTLQDGRCTICGFQPKQLYIDHDHSTGQVRGLLCSSCNTGLGCFRDNVEYMEKAIGYLTSNKSKEVGKPH